MTQQITGHTKFLAHLGTPTHSFKAPMIYNPFFEARGIDAIVIPMGCQPQDFAAALPVLFDMDNIAGALITMPHKIRVTDLLDDISLTARVCGSCNAVRRDENGRLIGDMFDGEGFVRGVLRKGRSVAGASALVVGAGGVGSAIAASLANAGAARIGVFDSDPARCDALAGRLRQYFPGTLVVAGGHDPEGFDIVVNATPIGMNEKDPMPLDANRIAPGSFVGDVVMTHHETAFMRAAQARGCQVQPGLDMLFEQIPAYLEFFGFPSATSDELRDLAKLQS